MRRRRIQRNRGAKEYDLLDAIADYERMLGVKLSDLEDGDEEALKKATRALRKQFMKALTADLEYEKKNRRDE